MFGSVNSEVIEHLEFALQGVRGERGHKLEGVHADRQLKVAEDSLVQTIYMLKAYLKKGSD